MKNAGGAFGFALGSYDRAAPLTIDPGLLYSTMFGGVDADSVADMVRGADGSFYLAGSTSGPGFITGAQPYDLGDHSIRGTGVAVPGREDRCERPRPGLRDRPLGERL